MFGFVASARSVAGVAVAARPVAGAVSVVASARTVAGAVSVASPVRGAVSGACPALASRFFFPTTSLTFRVRL